MNEDIHNKLDDHESRIGQLETKYDGLDGRIDSLEKWIPILIQDNKDSLRMMQEQVNGIRSDVNKATDIHREIVKDASSRIPKWAMWAIGTFGGVLIASIIGVGAWIVEAVVYKH